MSCSTRRGGCRLHYYCRIELDTGTRGERPAHGLGWHCMALHGIGIGIAQFQSPGAREIGAGPKPSLIDRPGSTSSASLPGLSAGMASAIATACI